MGDKGTGRGEIIPSFCRFVGHWKKLAGSKETAEKGIFRFWNRASVCQAGELCADRRVEWDSPGSLRRFRFNTQGRLGSWRINILTLRSVRPDLLKVIGLLSVLLPDTGRDKREDIAICTSGLHPTHTHFIDWNVDCKNQNLEKSGSPRFTHGPMELSQ